MKLLLTGLTKCILAVSLTISVGAYADSVRDLHILAIGNGHYAQSNQSNSLVDPTGAPVSARLALTRLGKQFGAKSAILLRSDKARLISRDDVFQALNTIRSHVGQSNKDDLVIVYYNGHGFGEGIAWNYFLQPGDVGVPQQLNTFDPVALSEQLIHVADIVDRLRTMAVPYILLLDTCYEGTAANFTSPVLSDEATRNLEDVASVLRFMNQFRDPNPVIFSALPGDIVYTVPPPESVSLQTVKIGPLARRLVLALEKAQKGRAVQLQWLLEELKSPLLDGKTAPAITYASVEGDFGISPSAGSLEVETVFGTASPENYRPLNQDAGSLAALPDTKTPADIEFATLRFVGDLGEYVSDGAEHIFLHGDDLFEVAFLEPGEIGFRISSRKGDWDVSFAVPSGQRFEPGLYAAAQRYPFQDTMSPGMELSGDGRGCNEIEGRFTVDSVSYEGDSPVALEISFVQRCDDETGEIRGYLNATLSQIR